MEESLDFPDWESPRTELRLNPRLPAAEIQSLKARVARAPALDSHVLLASSGTTGALKLIALSKPAFLASAQSVNARLTATAADRWALCLPLFHVGGLGIGARAHLSGARVDRFTPRWDPLAFHAFCRDRETTLVSLVPTQLLDLLRARLRAPPRLRAVLIGGDALAQNAYTEALALGWPVLPCYGMTETGSQVATARLGSPELELLPHVEARLNAQGQLCFKGPSLFTAYLAADGGWDDPKHEGWFTTEDHGELRGCHLVPLGRHRDFVKVGGESVDLKRLRSLLGNGDDVFLVALEDERLGAKIVLAATHLERGKSLMESFNTQVAPFERARAVCVVPEIPRNALGKVNQAALREMLLRCAI